MSPVSARFSLISNPLVGDSFIISPQEHGAPDLIISCLNTGTALVYAKQVSVASSLTGPAVSTLQAFFEEMNIISLPQAKTIDLTLVSLLSLPSISKLAISRVIRYNFF